MLHTYSTSKFRCLQDINKYVALPLLVRVKNNTEFPRRLAFEALGFETRLTTLLFCVVFFFNVYILPDS